MQGEGASADVDAAASHLEHQAKLINEGGYTKHQICNVDETVLYWKEMPNRTFIAREEKSVSGFKGQADSLVKD